MRLVCTPESSWKVEGEDIPPAAAGGLAGLMLWLAGRGVELDLEPGLAWLRQGVCRCLERVALLRALPEECPWTGGEWERESLPLIPGAEYVSESLLKYSGELLWKGLREAVGKAGGWDEWLAGMGEHWSFVGKVVFHLAELPAGAERPFGFLATYAGSLSREGRPKHIPLARALKEFRESNRNPELLLEPLRKASERCPWLCHALESRLVFRASSLSLEETYAFLKAVPALREAGVVTRMPSSWEKGAPGKVVVKVLVGDSRSECSSPGRPLWDFRASLALDGLDLSEEEWERVRNCETGLVLLRGKWVEVDSRRLSGLMADWSRIGYMYRQGVPLSAAMRLLAGVVTERVSAGPLEGEAADWSVVEAGKSLRARMREMEAWPDFPRDLLPGVRLRPYQEQGAAWLLSLYRCGMGACLADDMGLGKTLQVIAFLSWLKREYPADSPSLIVAPASLLSNWQSELERFSPGLRVFVAHGSRGSGGDKLPQGPEIDVVLTTYSLVHRRAELSALSWRVAVMDEAQNVKNPESLQARALKNLPAGMKIALTGTPVENGLSDLWSLMDIINPGLLGENCSSFLKTLDGNGRKSGLPSLRRLIAPVVLRRMKRDPEVALHLPPRTELLQCCLFTRRQAILYAHLAEELKKNLFARREQARQTEPESRGEPDRGGGQSALVLQYMMKFKQLCDHPSLLNGDNGFEPEESGKFLRLGELVREWAARQERVLVFTQFREMCAPLARFLTGIYGRPGLVMHGGVSLAQRKADVEAFQRSDGPPFYILSLKTAGTGLTLTRAEHVVHFDRWWNPAVESQASDRAYRLGQTKAVFVHKFMTPGTVEEKIEGMLRGKSELARDILSFEEGMEKNLLRMNEEELLSFFAPQW